MYGFFYKQANFKYLDSSDVKSDDEEEGDHEIEEEKTTRNSRKLYTGNGRM